MLNTGPAREGFVRLDRIRKVYGSVVALDDVSLDIAEGEFVTFLGPSGSGKTTCLRAIAGMMTPDSGSIVISGRDVSTMPMNKRNIGMVFQNYSLFPHMSVVENVGYPLRVRKVGAQEAQKRVEHALSLVRLAGYGDRRPDQLSGGQQQRVALARALVFEPSVLLLDEPLSALDRVLREEMQFELRRIHQEVGTTIVCVTHDRSEALTMADRIVVMRAGAIVQNATPEELYMRSNSRFVAEFLGETNVIPVTLDEGGRLARDETGRVLRLADPAAAGSGEAEMLIRIENVGIHPAREASSVDGDWRGQVREALFLGDAVRFVIDLTPHVITARVPLERAKGIAPGQDVSLDLTMQAPMIFPVSG